MCQVNIVSVLGLTQGGALVAIRVVGTAAECPSVRVSIDCQGNEISKESRVDAAGNWTVDFLPADRLQSAECRCNGPITVRVFCTTDHACEDLFQGEVPCKPGEPGAGCPTIADITAVPGPCNADGTVTVATTATISPAPGGPNPVFVQWVHDGAPGSANAVSAANTPVTATHNYPGDGAIHTATLAILYPTACSQGSVTFATRDCDEPGCPSISFETPQISAECTPELKRRVKIVAHVLLSGQPVTAQLVDNTTGMVIAANTSTVPFVLSATRDYPPGSHTVTVQIAAPAGCGSAALTFDVEACPDAKGCPRIEITVGEGDCVNGRRPVAVAATINPSPGVPTSASLVHNGITLASSSGTGPFTLTDTRLYPPGPQTVAVNVTAPVGCKPENSEKNFTVSDCPPPPTPPPTTADGEGFGCLIGRWVVVLLLGLALFLFLVFVCVPATGTGVLIAAGAALGLALILLALWLIFCGSQCSFLTLVWEVMVVTSVVAFYLSGCCPWLIWLAIGLAILAFLLFAAWISACNPAECVVLRELSAAFVIGAATALDLISPIAPCGLPLVAAINSGIAAILTALTLARCVAGGASPSASSSSAMLRGIPGGRLVSQRSTVTMRCPTCDRVRAALGLRARSLR